MVIYSSLRVIKHRMRLALTTLFLALSTGFIFGQAGTEDIGVYNTTIDSSPIGFPNGIGVGSFDFEALNGITLMNNQQVSVTVCLAKLDFNFVDFMNIQPEISGTSLDIWDSWSYDSFSQCIIGTITSNVDSNTISTIEFPIVSTDYTSATSPYYSQSLINVNLQPHPNDAYGDSNDQDYNWTHTYPLPLERDTIYALMELNETFDICVDQSELIGNPTTWGIVDSSYAGILTKDVALTGCFQYTPSIFAIDGDQFELSISDHLGYVDYTLVIVEIDLPPCGPDHQVIDDPVAQPIFNPAISLEATGTVDVSESSVLLAGNSVTLNPGFEVILGGELLASIKPCN